MGGRCNSYAITKDGIKVGFTWKQIGQFYSELYKKDQNLAKSLGNPNLSDEACKKVAQMIYNEKHNIPIPPAQIFFTEPIIEFNNNRLVPNIGVDVNPYNITHSFVVLGKNEQNYDMEKWLMLTKKVGTYLHPSHYKTTCFGKILPSNNLNLMGKHEPGVYLFKGCFPTQVDVNKNNKMFVTLCCDSVEKVKIDEELIKILTKLETNILNGWTKEAIVSALKINGFKIDERLVANCKYCALPKLRELLKDIS